MDKNHPNSKDPRPKRRRDNDNPYEIFSVGRDTDCPHYYTSFLDHMGVRICVEISKELFDELNQFELDDLSYLNEVDRHYSYGELNDKSMEIEAVSLEEIILEENIKQQLRLAISWLPEIQRRRVCLYFFENYTYERIAKEEGCTKRAIKKSIDLAIASLKKYF